jgi:catechol 2,3-dioxygenase-like lactoylglutathione lyase family enzyme
MIRMTGLDHYTLRVRDVDASLAFYRTVLGLEPGPRPATLRNPEHWLYAGERAVIHLFSNRFRDSWQGGLVDESRPALSLSCSGSIDHIAFRSGGRVEDARAHLRSLNVPFQELSVPGTDIRQLFVVDPDDVTIETQFFR